MNQFDLKMKSERLQRGFKQMWKLDINTAQEALTLIFKETERLKHDKKSSHYGSKTEKLVKLFQKDNNL